MNKLVNDVYKQDFDHLIADASFPINTAIVSLAAGQGLLVRGAVVGKNNAGESVLYGGDTVVKPEFILTDDVDTGGEEADAINATVYVSGVFNRDALVLAGETKVETIETELKTYGIYLKIVL